MSDIHLAPAMAEGGPEILPTLPELTANAERLWGAASMVRANRFPGFTTTFVDGRASFTQQINIANRDTLSIYRGDDFDWRIEQTRRRPSVETEGLGMTVETTTTYPLTQATPVTRMSVMGRPNADGSLGNPTVLEASIRDLDETACRNMLTSLQFIRGEDQNRQRRTPGFGGLLQKLGAAAASLFSPKNA